MDNKAIAICVIALVAIVGVALSVGFFGSEGGDGPEKVRQDYHLELTEHTNGYSLEITLIGQSWGVVELYLGDDPLLDGGGTPSSANGLMGIMYASGTDYSTQRDMTSKGSRATSASSSPSTSSRTRFKDSLCPRSASARNSNPGGCWALYSASRCSLSRPR